MIDLIAANHTNRELEVMLEGRKPLAFFCDEINVLPHEEIIPEERFRPYVESGRFVREEIVLNGGFNPRLGRDDQIKYVFFALKEEAWRIPAFILAYKVHKKNGAPYRGDRENRELTFGLHRRGNRCMVRSYVSEEFSLTLRCTLTPAGAGELNR
jgi:hypothetical protein